MPELPEVEAAKRLLDSHCLGATIVKAVVDNDTKVIDGVTPAALQESLTGKKILSTHRKGKHLWLKLDSPPWPSFQFGVFLLSLVLDDLFALLFLMLSFLMTFWTALLTTFGKWYRRQRVFTWPTTRSMCVLVEGTLAWVPCTVCYWRQRLVWSGKWGTLFQRSGCNVRESEKSPVVVLILETLVFRNFLMHLTMQAWAARSLSRALRVHSTGGKCIILLLVTS